MDLRGYIKAVVQETLAEMLAQPAAPRTQARKRKVRVVGKKRGRPAGSKNKPKTEEKA